MREDLFSNYMQRFEYRGHYQTIDNTRQLKALLREGQYAFPGGYAVIAYTSDGAALCNKCIKENLSSVLWSIRHNASDGWKVCGLDLYYGVEDNGETYCDNCGKNWEDI
jgi:hypothetical protein